MPISADILTRITSLKQELNALQLEYQDAKADELTKLPEWQVRFATYLHFQLCPHEHPEGCNWYNEEWDDVSKPVKDEYLQIAESIKVDVVELMKNGEVYYNEVIEAIFLHLFPERNTPTEQANYQSEIDDTITNYYGV